jgi:signal transduction histidine kinase
MGKRNSLFIIVAAILVLLLSNIVLTYFNNKAIAENRSLQAEILNVQHEYDKIGMEVIHPLDIGLRGFAVNKKPGFITPLYDGIDQRDTVLANLERSLRALHYPDFRLSELRDSLDSYIALCLPMKELIEQDRFDQFRIIYDRNYGNDLWGVYTRTQKDLLVFLDSREKEATARYENAIEKNLWLQIIIFILCTPTLIYTAINTNKAFQSINDLRKIENEKYRWIEEQNQTLERKVLERTQEIERKNADLELEVSKRTAEISQTNQELLEQNSKLEQFAFTVAHNLRAPITRIMGLAHVIDITPDEADRKYSTDKIVLSARELDSVVRDLNSILENSRRNGKVTQVPIKTIYDRVLKSLESEIAENEVFVTSNIYEGYFYTIAPYFESVLLNLLSNAIKYRDPARKARVEVKIELIDVNSLEIKIEDNGLGIDLEKFGTNLFGLYRRFHLHVDGKGLGLYLVKSQVLAMRGKVDVSSRVGEGTVFTIVLEDLSSFV